MDVFMNGESSSGVVTPFDIDYALSSTIIASLTKALAHKER